MSSTHPKPWKAEKISGPYRRWRLTDANGVVFLRGLDESTALEIVAAVNSHSDLLAACEAWDAHLRKLDEADDLNGDHKLKELRNGVNRERIALTRSAISKARGTT